MTRLHTVTEMGWPFQNNYLVPSLGWYGRPYLYQLVAGLPFGLGWPLAVVALAGVVVALRRHELADRIVLAALLPYFLVIGSSRVTFSRYLLPLFPGLLLLAARALCDLPRAPRAALLATVLAYSLVLATSQVARFSTRQQREIARWIAGLRPPGSAERLRVAVPPAGTGAAHLPPGRRRPLVRRSARRLRPPRLRRDRHPPGRSPLAQRTGPSPERRRRLP